MKSNKQIGEVHRGEGNSMKNKKQIGNGQVGVLRKIIEEQKAILDIHTVFIHPRGANCNTSMNFSLLNHRIMSLSSYA